MDLFGYEFKKKSAQIKRDRETNDVIGISSDDLGRYLGVFSPTNITGNTVSLFEEMSEIYFPVIAIVNRICNGRFILKESKTDGVVYENDQINKLLSQPNILQSFEEFVKQAVAYKLVTGRSYVYSNMGDFINPKMRWKMCDSYSVLPAHLVQIRYQDRMQLFSAESKNEIIQSYDLNTGYETLKILPDSIMHLKDVCLSFGTSQIEGHSRLSTLKYPICNLMAVYEARNAIYIKRGALGAIVSKKTDESGSIPLNETEKKSLRDDYNNAYGVTSGKDNTMITGVPIEFIRFNQSIQELQPFEETLSDAVQIAGVYGVPAVLIPRKDQATFSNQDSAEKSLYENTVIPEAISFCRALNSFLGLENDGLYLDVSFDHIPVLQPNAREKAMTGKMISESCKMNFLAGVITLNDWIAQVGGSRVAEKLYDKYILQMNNEELNRLRDLGIINNSRF